MRIGLGLPNRGAIFGATTIPQMLQLAALADQTSSIDSVWVSDSLLAKPRPEAITLLAAIAARTERVAIGTACLASFPLRDPVLLATQWATLDQLAGGRTVLAVCSGIVEQSGAQVESTLYGVSNADRVQRLVEGIQVLKLLWTQDDVNYVGRHYHLSHVTVEPKPAAKPCPPIWIAANADRPDLIARSHERIVRHADGWQTVRGAAQIATRLADIKQRLAAAGRDRATFTCSAYVNVNIGDDRDLAFAETKRFLDTYFSADSSREHIEEWSAFGPADECAKYLRRYREAGVDELIVRCASWSQAEQVRRLTEEVLPLLLG